MPMAIALVSNNVVFSAFAQHLDYESSKKQQACHKAINFCYERTINMIIAEVYRCSKSIIIGFCLWEQLHVFIITTMKIRNGFKNKIQKEGVSNEAVKKGVAKNEAVKNEAVKNEAGKNEAGKNEGGKNEAVQNEAGKNEAVKNEAGKNEAVKNEAGKNEA